MPITDHRYQPNGEVHQAHNFEYADLAALQAASGFTANDNRKLALVLDSNDLWILTDWSGPTWKKAGGSAWIDDDGTEPTTAPVASGAGSIAIGDVAVASGVNSIAGANSTAAGDYSIILSQEPNGVLLTSLPDHGWIDIYDYNLLALTTVNINGTILTEGTDWTAQTSNTITASNLRNAINLGTGTHGVTATIRYSNHPSLIYLTSAYGNFTTLITTFPNDGGTEYGPYNGAPQINQGTDELSDYSIILGPKGGMTSSINSTIINGDNAAIIASDNSAIISSDSCIISDSPRSMIIGAQNSYIKGDSNEYCYIFGGYNNKIYGRNQMCAIINSDAHEMINYSWLNTVINDEGSTIFDYYGYNTLINTEGCFLNEYAYGCTVTGSGHLIGGNYVTAKGINGLSTRTSNIDVHAFGHPTISRSQVTRQINRTYSTNATPANPTQFFRLEQLMPNGGVFCLYNIYKLKVEMVAIQIAGTAGTIGDACIKEYDCVMKIYNGTASIFGDVSETLIAYDVNAENWGLIFTADDVNKIALIQFVGETNKTIRTTLSITCTELGTL